MPSPVPRAAPCVGPGLASFQLLHSKKSASARVMQGSGRAPARAPTQPGLCHVSRGHAAAADMSPRAANSPVLGPVRGGVTRVSQHRARSIILEHYYRFGFCDLNGNKSRVNLDNVSFLNGVLSMYKLRIHACIC